MPAAIDIEKSIGDLHTEFKQFLTDSRAELDKQRKDFDERVLALEQKAVSRGNVMFHEPDHSLGKIVLDSEQFKGFVSTKANRTGQIEVGSFTKAMVNASGLNQPLVPADYRVGVVTPGLQRLTIRDLIPTTVTTSNMITYPEETGYTNNAGMQASEGATKPESSMAYALRNVPVGVLAHFVTISRQLLEDSTALNGYLNTRLLYGLKQAEDGQLLNGDGTGANLAGLVTKATAFDTTKTVAGDTKIDTIRRAILQTYLSNFPADGVILNPLDWAAIEMVKTTGTASSGEYILSDPKQANSQRLWGLPVVQTPAMTVGNFLVGSFSQAAMIFDRANATIELSREHASNFTANLATVLCEERLAVVVFRPAALIFGAFVS